MGYFTSSKKVDALRKQYPVGARVKLLKMNDLYSKMCVGEEGTVTGVDDIGTVHCKWDCGSTLGVVYEEDEICIID